MKVRDYLKELSLVVVGVLIALLIDNYRENLRETRVVNSYLSIVAEDLNFDIQSLTAQLRTDSAYAKKLKLLSDVLTSNTDLPRLNYSLASWSEPNSTQYRNLSKWDSLDYYSISLYSNTQYQTRKIGFSTIVNSNLSHRIDNNLLKKITVYYTTDSDYLDFAVGIDEKCHWNAIPFLNNYQGSFKNVILNKDFNATLLRNEASGRYSTTIREMKAKHATIEKAKALLSAVESY